MLDTSNKRLLAYVTGIALGDGNLSNPNGRAVRLRITCDIKYPFLVSKIEQSIKTIAPNNKVSRIKRADKAIDISCYSNHWEEILGWKAVLGTKILQNICVPKWILENKEYCKACLCGLFETDGSIYKDRKYLTVNFVTQIPNLAQCVEEMLCSIGYTPSIQKLNLASGGIKFTFRIHKKSSDFIKELNIQKI